MWLQLHQPCGEQMLTSETQTSEQVEGEVEEMKETE